jgi:hypothetical protein
MRSSVLVVGVTIVAAPSLHASLAQATTYQVGPTRAHAQLEQFEEALAPGDVVEIDGDATYTGDVWLESWGTAAAPVIIRGLLVNGRRPVFAGGDYTLMFKGGYYIVENVEVTGGAEVCLFQKAENLVLRDSLVRDCENHGILGADWEAGSFFMQRVEVRGSGYDVYKHQVYVATDETTFPGSVFRMEGCWIHDASGGINVKSRAERVELYGNWIEGAQYHELDLVGSQEHPVDIAREDSDVVGNVLVKAPGNAYTIARVGGDGTGDTHGRHRFVNNTIVLADATEYVFRLGGQLESFELHNNVIHGQGATQLWREEYPGTMEVLGTTNWIAESVTMIDGRVSGLRGAAPGFESFVGADYRPGAASPLIDAATPWPAAPPGMEVPNAQGTPALMPVGPGAVGHEARPSIGGLDIGAFERDDGSRAGAGSGAASSTAASGSGGEAATGVTAASSGIGGGGDDTNAAAGTGGGDASSSAIGSGGARPAGPGDGGGGGGTGDADDGDGDGTGDGDDDGVGGGGGRRPDDVDGGSTSGCSVGRRGGPGVLVTLGVAALLGLGRRRARPRARAGARRRAASSYFRFGNGRVAVSRSM